MLICNYCGNSFDENDLENGLCPYCHSDEHEEAYQCLFCGEYFARDDLDFGYCQDCYNKAKDDYRHDLSGLRHIISDTDNIKINSLYGHYFNESEIDEILYNELKKSKSDYIDFIEGDPSYFMQELKYSKEKEA